jgi:outer membrane protein OmpA-like peptidoglycan-associated protein
MKNPLSSVSTASPEWASFRRVYWTIAAVLAFLLLMSWIAGFGPGGRACKIPGMAAGNTSAPRAAAAPVVKPAATAEAPKTAASAVATAAPASAAAAAAAAAPVPATPTPAPAAPPPAAKLYFPLDKITLPQNTVAALLPVVTYLQANESAKASISGFHDPTGKKARNEELALNRARAARGALERAGIARERIVMQKPQVTTGSGGAAEARRVEVAVQMP